MVQRMVRSNVTRMQQAGAGVLKCGKADAWNRQGQWKPEMFRKFSIVCDYTLHQGYIVDLLYLIDQEENTNLSNAVPMQSVPNYEGKTRLSFQLWTRLPFIIKCVLEKNYVPFRPCVPVALSSWQRVLSFRALVDIPFGPYII